MKICLACNGTFVSEIWSCPACGSVPSNSAGFLSFAPEFASANDGFSGDYFERLHAVESGHFWFQARNRLIQALFARYFKGASTLLEIGCGTGFVLSGLQRRFPELVLAGSEIFDNGLDFARSRLPGVELFQMDARKIPFENEFDVVGAFDVLEHIEEDERVLAAMFRACRPGGGVILSVPQHQFLWSRVDEYAHHKRRYSRGELVRKVEGAGFQVMRTTSFVSALLPLLILSRWKRNRAASDFDPCAEFRIGTLANRALEAILDNERRLIELGISFPAGGSLVLTARKNQAT